MNENNVQPTGGKRFWWFVWILCTVIVPGVIFGLLVTVIQGHEEFLHLGWLFALLHIVASVKLGRDVSGWLTAGLIFGGWILMLVSFFVGCLAVVASR